MDPVTLVVSALAAGASAALKDTASAAVRDAYAGLKALVARKLAGDPRAEVVLESNEKQPETWAGPMKDLLTKADAASDAQLIEAAQGLLATVDPAGAATGKYNVTVSGGQVGAIGDNANVHMSGGSD